MHEDLTRQHEVRAASDRSFGLMVATVLTGFGLVPLMNGHGVRPWLLAAASIVLLVALARPLTLSPFNRVWIGLGLRLGRIMNPVFLGVVFFMAVTPLGWLVRLSGRGGLTLRRDPAARTYWITRTPAVPPSSMTQQF